MAVTTALFWFSLVLTVIGSNGSGELSILHSPDSLHFAGSSKILESSLKELFSACLGLSVEENSDWNGIVIKDPFNTPEAVVEVYIDGVSSLGNVAQLKAKNFPLVVDEYEPDTYDAVKHRINQRFNNGGSKLVSVALRDPNEVTAFSTVFGELKEVKFAKRTLLQHLKSTVEEDFHFLTELETLKSITERVKSGIISADNAIDFFYFRFRSLHPLSDFHGPNSLPTKEAKRLLSEALKELSDAFVKAYDGRVLVAAVTTDVAHTRRPVRSVRADPMGDESEDGKEVDSEGKGNEGKGNTGDIITETSTLPSAEENKKDAYAADYAAIFNIILWFGVVISFTLVAIVYALMDMDPGRDSIIYRMTNTRMKKDN